MSESVSQPVDPTPATIPPMPSVGSSTPETLPEGNTPPPVRPVAVPVHVVGSPDEDNSPATDDLPAIPGYDLLQELGRGGMGVVYRAQHLALKRIVALKMVLGFGGDSDALHRFRAEAEAVVRLHHPNIVQIYEVGARAGRPYCALEYVDGGTLAKKLAQTPQPARYAAAVVQALARAVHHAHEQGIAHRDLKPSNVMLTRQGTPKVTDFGLAKKLDDDAGRTQTGAVLGTPSYMAPEQAEGKTSQIGPLADVYALGAILYEMQTGRPPFRGTSVIDTLEQVRNSEPVPPSHLNPAVPRDLETICLKCLQKDPSKRYGSADELANDLRRFLGGEPVQARPVGMGERVWRWCWRNPVAALLVISLVVGFVVATSGWVKAKLNGDEKERQRLAAIDAGNKAHAEAERALAAEGLRRQQRYWADLPLASQFFRDGRIKPALDLLDRERPEPGQEDLRQFEWYALYELCHGEKRVLKQRAGEIAYSPDGRLLALAGVDGVIRLLDAGTGQPLIEMHGHHCGITGLAFSPDSKRLASGGWTPIEDRPDHQEVPGELKLWDVTTGQECVTFRSVGTQTLPWSLGLSMPHVRGLAFSPDGKEIATACRFPNVVQLWDASTGQEVGVLKGTEAQMMSVAYAPDGQTLAAGDWERSVWVWDRATRKVRWQLREGDLGKVMSVAITPDSRILAAEAESGVQLWDLTTGKPLRFLRGAAGSAGWLASAPRGRLLAVTQSRFQVSEVHLWDLDTFREVAVLRGHTDVIHGLAFSADGQTLASSGATARSGYGTWPPGRPLRRRATTRISAGWRSRRTAACWRHPATTARSGCGTRAAASPGGGSPAARRAFRPWPFLRTATASRPATTSAGLPSGTSPTARNWRAGTRAAWWRTSRSCRMGTLWSPPRAS